MWAVNRAIERGVLSNRDRCPIDRMIQYVLFKGLQLRRREGGLAPTQKLAPLQLFLTRENIF